MLGRKTSSNTSDLLGSRQGLCKKYLECQSQPRLGEQGEKPQRRDDRQVKAVSR